MSEFYITNGITQDGFGARFQRVIQTMSFTFYLRDYYNIDVSYIHTPFYYEGFGETYSEGENIRSGCGYDNMIKRESYIERAKIWEEKLNYNGVTVCGFIYNKLKTKNDLFYDIEHSNTKGNLYMVNQLHQEFNCGAIDINIIDKYRTEILSMFDFNKITSASDDMIVHIRRSDSVNEPQRHITDNYYLEFFDELKPCNYNIIIHTQRKGFDSSLYSKYVVVYDDEEEESDFFIKMVNCKNLLVSKSSISIAAGLLNNGNIIYPPQNTIGLKRFFNKNEFIKKIKMS